jgi:hypothetical protein
MFVEWVNEGRGDNDQRVNIKNLWVQSGAFPGNDKDWYMTMGKSNVWR